MVFRVTKRKLETLSLDGKLHNFSFTPAVIYLIDFLFVTAIQPEPSKSFVVDCFL